MSSGITPEAIQQAVARMREWMAREGDERDFEEEGYHCLILRNAEAGYLSGFVGVPGNHPYFGLESDAVEEIDVHGGLEFSGPQVAGGRGRPGFWYLGFDCDHFDDLYLKELMSLDPVSVGLKRGSSYKNMEYVEREVRGLAQKLKAAEHKRIYR